MLRAAAAALLLMTGVHTCPAQSPYRSDLRLHILDVSPAGPVSEYGDTTAVRTRDSKSPGVAMLLSAALPGAGQFYNESYWKVPVVMGLGGYFVVEWLHNNRLASDYRDQYSASLHAGAGDEGLRRLREFYKDQRDAFAWYFVILYAANILDAYVDASLYGFDVGPDLSATGVSTGIPRGPSVTFMFRF